MHPETRCAERVSLGLQAARGVDDERASVRILAGVDELTGFAMLAQPKRIVREKLRAR